MARTDRPVEPASETDGPLQSVDGAGGPGRPDGPALQIQVSGRPDLSSVPPPHFAELGLKVKVRGAVRPALSRAGDVPELIRAEPDDVVELTMQDGARLW